MDNRKNISKKYDSEIDPTLLFTAFYPMQTKNDIAEEKTTEINPALLLGAFYPTPTKKDISEEKTIEIDPALLLGAFYPTPTKKDNREEKATEIDPALLLGAFYPTPTKKDILEEKTEIDPALLLGAFYPIPTKKDISEEKTEIDPALLLGAFYPTPTKKDIPEEKTEIDPALLLGAFYPIQSSTEQRLQQSAFQLTIHEDCVKQVKILLKGLNANEEMFPDFSNTPQYMLFGMKILLQHYSILSDKKLSADQKIQIEKMLRVLNELEQKYLEQDFKLNLDLTKYQIELKNKYKTELKNTLDTKGEIYYLIGGYNRHHAISKITQEFNPETKTSTYYRTEFNAGLGTQFLDKPGLVWGINKRKIETDVINIIEHDLKNRFSIEDNKNNSLPNGYLQDTIQKDSHSVAPQHIGNCSVRSTLEMLRAELDNTTFKDFFYFIDKFNLIDQTAKFDKVSNYSQFTHSVIDEAIKLSQTSSIPLLDKAFLSDLEKFIIKHLLQDNNFSFFESDLLNNKSLIHKYAKLFLRDEILTKKHTFKPNSPEENHKLLITLISEYLKNTLKSSISPEMFNELSKKLNEFIYDKYFIVRQMDIKTLIHFSCVISEILKNTNFVSSQDNAIILNTSQENINNVEIVIQKYYSRLNTLPQSSLARDVILFEASVTCLEKAKQNRNLENISLVKNVLQTFFAEKKLSRKSIEVSINYLAKLISDPDHLNNLVIEKNPNDLIQKMKSGFWQYALNSPEKKTLDHVKITLFGTTKGKHNTKNNKKTATIIQKYEEKYGSLSLKESLRINNILNLCLTNKKLEKLQLLKMNDESIDNVIIEAINKNFSSPDLSSSIETIINLYHSNLEKLIHLDSFDENSIKQINTLIENKNTPPDVLLPILKKLIDLDNKEIIDLFLLHHNDSHLENVSEFLFKAIATGNKNLVTWLLERIDIEDAVDINKKFNPLMFTYHYIRSSHEDKELNANLNEISLLIKKHTSLDSLTDFLFNMANKKINARPQYQALSILIKECKVDINAKNKSNDTPLIIAVKSNNNDFVKTLIEFKADINYFNPNTDNTALNQAYKIKNLRMIEMLVKAGANDAFDILLTALKDKETIIVKKILDINPGLLTQDDSNHRSLLKIAYDDKNISMMKLLIEYKASDQESILSEIIKDKDIELTRQCIEWGIKSAASHLMDAYKNNSPDIIKILIEASCPGTEILLNKATEEGNKKIIDLITSLGITQNTSLRPR